MSLCTITSKGKTIVHKHKGVASLKYIEVSRDTTIEAYDGGVFLFKMNKLKMPARINLTQPIVDALIVVVGGRVDPLVKVFY